MRCCFPTAAHFDKGPPFETLAEFIAWGKERAAALPDPPKADHIQASAKQLWEADEAESLWLLRRIAGSRRPAWRER